MERIGLVPVLKQVAVGILLGLWALQSARQVPVWENDLTLWAHAAKVSPQKARAALNHAQALDARNQVDAAEAEYRRAWQLAADLPPKERILNDEIVRSNLGHLALVKGHVEEAITILDGLTAENPDFLPAQFNRAVAYARRGDCATANAIFDRYQLREDWRPPCGS